MSDGVLRLLLDARSARKRGPGALERLQRARLAEIVAFARATSPYYRQLYEGLPERVEDPALLPVTTKQALMARFDEWVTDRDVTLEGARAFVADPSLVAEPFLGKYTVATTSGTTGSRGSFVLDQRSTAVTAALTALLMQTWLDGDDIMRIVVRRGHFAVVIATGGHFAANVGITRVRRSGRLARRATRVFPVQTPLPELVDELNRFRPAILVGYASVIALLADEQAAGRLRIEPVLVQPGAETLAPGEFERIAGIFKAKIRDDYAATECLNIAYRCARGWLHVNSDWVVLEPVDAEYRPTPAGQASHTVLLSNLANRVQPILRYDLGDSVLRRPDPCPCGNPLPAIQVQGRAADVLTFATERDERVALAPLAIATLMDRVPGLELAQVVQTTRSTLRVRLRAAGGADSDGVWRAVQAELVRLLAEHGLGHVILERAEEPPEPSPGGKYRTVIPLG